MMEELEDARRRRSLLATVLSQWVRSRASRYRSDRRGRQLPGRSYRHYLQIIVFVIPSDQAAVSMSDIDAPTSANRHGLGHPTLDMRRSSDARRAGAEQASLLGCNGGNGDVALSTSDLDVFAPPLGENLRRLDFTPP